MILRLPRTVGLVCLAVVSLKSPVGMQRSRVVCVSKKIGESGMNRDHFYYTDSVIKSIKAFYQIEKRLADAVNTGGTGVIK